MCGFFVKQTEEHDEGQNRIQLLAGTRHRRESDKAVQACNDYCKMQFGASLRKLLVRYVAQDGDVPTQSLDTLKGWSRRYGWQERLDLWVFRPDGELRKRLQNSKSVEGVRG